MKNVKCDIPSGLVATTVKSKFDGQFVIDLPAVIAANDGSMYMTQNNDGYTVHYHHLSFAVSDADAVKLNYLCINEKPKNSK